MFESALYITDRRRFVGAVATLGASVALGVDTRVNRFLVAQQPTAGAVSTSDTWLDRLKGRHRQLFDVPEPEGGTALRHLRNYLDAWRDAYGVGDRDVSVVVTLYAQTTPLGLQDEMWAKYQLGAALNLTDPTTNASLVRNWFAHPKAGDPVAGGEPETSMEALQRRGVVFALYNTVVPPRLYGAIDSIQITLALPAGKTVPVTCTCCSANSFSRSFCPSPGMLCEAGTYSFPSDPRIARGIPLPAHT